MRVEDSTSSILGTSEQILSKLNGRQISTTIDTPNSKITLEDCKTFLFHKSQYISDLLVKSKMVTVALRALSQKFPEAELENWKACASYMPHVEAVLRFDIKAESKIYYSSKSIIQGCRVHKNPGKVRDSYVVR
jgi:hypothetical protein